MFRIINSSLIISPDIFGKKSVSGRKNCLFRCLMIKIPTLFTFMALAFAVSAQTKMLPISYNQEQKRYQLNRIRKELEVKDSTFYETVDALIIYALDKKFSYPHQQIAVQSIANYLKKIKNKEQVNSGRCAEQLQFAFSIMDWRREGTLYENLKNYRNYAVKCAILYADDSAGYKFLADVAAEDPYLILTNNDQLTENPGYRSLIEDAIVKDPNFAKRYFFGENMVSKYGMSSRRKVVQDVYALFDRYGTKSKAYVLFDAVEKGRITPHQADSISQDNVSMIKAMVDILKTDSPYGLESVLHELDYKCIEWIRQSSLWTQNILNTEYNKFSPEEKLTILTFGYRECKGQFLDVYLALVRHSFLASVNGTLLKNLGEGPMPDFVQFLDKENKLSEMLSSFRGKEKEIITQMLAKDHSGEESNAVASLPPSPAITIAPKDETKVVAVPTPAPKPEPAKIVPQKSEPVIEKPAPVIAKADPIKVNPAPVAPVVPAPEPAKVATPKPAAPVVVLRPEKNFEDMSVEPISFPHTDSSRAILAIKRNIFTALQDISSFIQKPYAKDALMYAATVEPDEVFKKIDMFKGKYWCKDILEEACRNAPISARRYFINKTHPVTVVLGYSTDPVVKKFLKLSTEAEYQSKPFLLIDELAKGKITLDEATSISNDNERLFREMMKITEQKDYIGRFNVEKEMNYYALKQVRTINDKILLPEEQRYSTVDNLSCHEIYYLMVYGREEVFSTTFDGLFSRFMDKCSTAGWTANNFMAFPHYRNFMALCSTYGKLDKFLSLFQSPDQNLLLTTFASDLDKQRDQLADASTVAEAMSNATNNTVLQVIQNTIKATYINREMAHDYNGMAIYGILAALCKDKAQLDKKWFVFIAKKYRIGALSTLTNAAVNGQKVFVERMYFYDDEDGRDSYKNFITTYSAARNWKVEQYYSYAKVYATTGANVEIYANKAELEESGEREISKIIKDNNYIVRSVVHRGHSFHTESTLSRVPSSARFVFVGSCGGFYKINIALRKAPDAHIIATRQIGVKEVNDPIIFSFNEYIRQSKDINWKIFWDDAKVKLGNNVYFNDYVPPHKNLESLFVKAYYEIMGGQ